MSDCQDDSKCPRPYRLGQRQVSADEKRARIVSAARDLLSSIREVSGFTMDSVARQAGVARMTVYHQFGSKRGLLEAVFDELGRTGLVDRLRAAFELPIARDALAAFIGAFGSFWTANRLVIRRIRGLAVLDPDFEDGVRAREERRRKGLYVVLGRLTKELGIPEVRDLDEAVQIVHTLTSFETFDALAGLNRSPDDITPLIQKMVNGILKL
ncbi:MAG: TetR/AcrR family transcriptional regulator [Planctomycetaceae bacterium]|nr:TetR/AcrR family transcriptional regulator [Planctomycetaceae bacterium]